MPVIINARQDHPFLPRIGDSSSIDMYRAAQQDIRPLHILMINLMADKIGTERQITRLLGDTEIQVQMTFAATDTYIKEIKAGRSSRNTPTEHIEKFYSSFADVQEQKYDGLVVTGVNALQVSMHEEGIWDEITDILEWSKSHVTSSLFLCWGAQAALQYFHGIDRTRRLQKAYGLYEHDIQSDKTGLLSGFPDKFPVPVSNWDHTHEDDIRACDKLEMVSANPLTGAGFITEPRPYDDGKHHYPYRLFILNHPEYETDILGNEYKRDSATRPDYPLPHAYYPDNNPDMPVINNWRHTGKIYSNWIRAIYNATPYDIKDIPRPYERSKK